MSHEPIEKSGGDASIDKKYNIINMIHDIFQVSESMASIMQKLGWVGTKEEKDED